MCGIRVAEMECPLQKITLRPDGNLVRAGMIIIFPGVVVCHRESKLGIVFSFAIMDRCFPKIQGQSDRVAAGWTLCGRDAARWGCRLKEVGARRNSVCPAGPGGSETFPSPVVGQAAFASSFQSAYDFFITPYVSPWGPEVSSRPAPQSLASVSPRGDGRM